VSDAGEVSEGDGEGEILAVHFGHSANCSSVGSVVDVLFVSSVVGTAVLAALAVMLRRPEDGEAPAPDDDAPGEETDADEG